MFLRTDRFTSFSKNRDSVWLLAFIQQAESLVSSHVVPSCFHGNLRCLSFGGHVVLRESPALSLLRDVPGGSPRLAAFGFFVEMESAVGRLALRY